jgi:putative oxidoreductase
VENRGKKEQMPFDILTGLAPLASLPLRLVLGVAFLAHGYPKITGKQAEKKQSKLREIGVPPLVTVLTGLAQIVGGATLLLGLLTTPVSLLMAIMMGVTTAFSKWRLRLSYLRGYELDIAYLVSALSLAFLGGGPFSLDSLFGI